MTPETPPDVELPPLEEPTWEVRIRTAGGAESVAKAVQKQPAARRLPFSVLRAFELAQSQEGSKNWANGEELEEFQAAANAELEAMRAAAEKEEDGWVTTKSRARRPAPTATQAPIPTHLFP